jgi:hypothetical protein
VTIKTGQGGPGESIGSTCRFLELKRRRDSGSACDNRALLCSVLGPKYRVPPVGSQDL